MLLPPSRRCSVDILKGKRLSAFDGTWKPTWLIDGLWQAHGLNLLYGAPRTRKSTLRGYMAVCALARLPVFGLVPAGKPWERCIIVGGEEIPEAEAARLYHIGDSLGVPRAAFADRILLFGPDSGLRLDSEASVLALRRLVATEGADLVFLDPFVNFHSQNENDNAQMATILGRLMPVTEKATLVLLHHTSKPSADNSGRSVAHKARGASAIPGFTSVNLLLANVGEEDSPLSKLYIDAKYAERKPPLNLEYHKTTGLFSISTPAKRIAEVLKASPEASASEIARLAHVRKAEGLHLVKSERELSVPSIKPLQPA